MLTRSGVGALVITGANGLLCAKISWSASKRLADVLTTIDNPVFDAEKDGDLVASAKVAGAVFA